MSETCLPLFLPPFQIYAGRLCFIEVGSHFEATGGKSTGLLPSSSGPHLSQCWMESSCSPHCFQCSSVIRVAGDWGGWQEVVPTHFSSRQVGGGEEEFVVHISYLGQGCWPWWNSNTVFSQNQISLQVSFGLPKMGGDTFSPNLQSWGYSNNSQKS